MALPSASDNKFPKLIVQEAANDGSDFSNPAADYRVLFLGEDGQLHVKDSSGTVTAIGAAGSVATDTIWDAAGDLVQGTGSNTAARLAVGASGAILYVSAGSAAWGHPSGSVVQVVRANATGSDDSTSSGTLQASSLSAAITPVYSNSIIMAEVQGECSFGRTAGTILERTGFVAIVNTTNSVTLCEQVRGVNLIGTSAATNSAYAPIGLIGMYTVNSTTARTFQLQYRSNNASNVTATISNSRTGGTHMILTELRA